MSTSVEDVVVTTPEVPVEPVAPSPDPVPTPTPAPIEEKRYEYQPVDADGRPMGGKQVIIYRTQEELAYKLSQQNTELLRKLREVTRKQALGIVDDSDIPETRYTGPTEFTPRTLTSEQRAELALQIVDPEHFDQAIQTVFEASVGTSPQGLAAKLTQLEQDNANIKALRESDRFMAANPDYVKCEENGAALAQWVARRGYAPTAENFQKAYDTLLAQGVLVTSLEVIPQQEFKLPEPPVDTATATVAEPPATAPVREEIPVDNQVPLETPPVTKVVSRVPVGLSRDNSSDSAPVPVVGSDIVYQFIQRDAKGNQIGEPRIFKGRAAIEAMPSDEYKRRLLHEPGFAAKVEKLNKR